MRPRADAARCRARLTPSPTVALVVVLALSVVAAACGGGGEGDSEGSSSASSSASKDAAAKTTKTQATTKDGIPTGKPGETVDVTVGTPPPGEEPAHPSNQADPNANPKPGDGSGIVITAPTPFTTVVGTVKIEASATIPTTPGMSITWSITRGDDKPLAQGELHGVGRCIASPGGEICRMNLATTANVAKVPVGSYELHVTTFDKAGKQLGDTLVPISIHAKADPGDVPSDAPPPG